MAGRSHKPQNSRSEQGGSGTRRSASGSYRSSQQTFAPRTSRLFIPLIIFAVLAIIVLFRLVYLQVIMAPTYSEMAEDTRTVQIPMEPRRGTIYDRNGNILAVSVDAASIYATSSEIDSVSETAEALASILGGKATDYYDSLTGDSGDYIAVARKVDTSVGDAIEALELSGIYVLEDTRREYPNGQTAAQIVGVCSTKVDEEQNREYYYGISGLEEYYDDILSGEVGYYEAERGLDGTPIPGGVHESTPAVDGQDIIISIDLELQEYVENRLEQGVSDLGGSSGSSVVIDAATGEIYAAASLPLFDPSNRAEIKEGATNLKVVTDLFEPGSIFKTVSMMAILETDTMKPDDTIFCPSSITVDDYTISDAHERDDATYSLREILDVSSNVGISLVSERMGFDKLYDYILKYNLHTKTGVDYPGEGEEDTDVLGYLAPYDSLSEVAKYNISFGQGLSLTPLQITRFYCAIDNNGVECTPHFLLSKPQTGETAEYETQDVITDKEAIATMTNMLEGVVTDGTGTEAAIDGFTVAGKTSTAQIYDEENGGYRDEQYNLAFVGFLSGSSSQLVCFVGANEVDFMGVVTPIFKDIMTTAIDRFNIVP